MSQSFSPTEEQKLAYKKVAKAIKEAKRKGLVFYGKSGSLVAYTKQADAYVESIGFEKCLGGYGQIDCISETGLIKDSGADDYPSYQSLEDRILHS